MAAAYHDLIPPYPRFVLSTYPSPLERAALLEQALRDEGCAAVPRIYLKRDDLLSLGMGGNKIRNLEFLIGRALEECATDVVTAGRQQSNHCRLTAAACARAGLRAHLVLTGRRPERLTGNLLLDEVLGARLYFTGSDDRGLRERWVTMMTAGFPSLGRAAAVFPVGGSDARGALGHVIAAAELMDQCRAIAERPSAMVLASATGGTQAGMLAGLAKFGEDVCVIGFAVAKSADELSRDVSRLAAEVAGEIGVPSPMARIVVDGGQLGGGYGVETAEGRKAIELAARTEGVLADPVYTGKALAGLLALVREGRFSASEVVVFVHTGGAPALFA